MVGNRGYVSGGRTGPAWGVFWVKVRCWLLFLVVMGMEVLGVRGLLLDAVRIDYRQEAPRKVCPDSSAQPSLLHLLPAEAISPFSLNREKSSEGSPPQDDKVSVS